MALFDPVLASWYRSIVVQADNAMWLWWGKFDADDYLVAVVADERRSDHDRRAAYQTFLTSNGLDPHFGERMRAHFLEHGVTALTVLLPENHWVVSFLLKFVEQGPLGHSGHRAVACSTLSLYQLLGCGIVVASRRRSPPALQWEAI